MFINCQYCTGTSFCGIFGEDEKLEGVEYTAAKARQFKSFKETKRVIVVIFYWFIYHLWSIYFSIQ